MLSLLLNPRVIVFFGAIATIVALYRVHSLKVEEFKTSVINEVVIHEQAAVQEQIEVQHEQQVKIITVYKDRIRTNEKVIKEIEQLPLKSANEINKKYQEIMKCFESC